MNKQAMRKMNNKVMRLWSRIIEAMDDSVEDYSPGDITKMSLNIGLVIVFFEAADKARISGRSISAKKITEDLRHDVAVGDDSTEYKISNNITALLAHVYNDVIGSEYFIRKQRTPFESKAA